MRHAPGSLVNRYAGALFSVALDQDRLGKVREDLENICETWRTNPELALMLTNPSLTHDKVKAFLTALAERLKVAELTRNFLKVLMEKDRLIVLYDVSERFNQLWRDHEGEVELNVVTAIPLSERMQTEVHDALAAQSGKKPLITWVHEPSLLGGIVVQWPDRIFDGSLARKLANMKEFLAQGA